MTGEKFCKSASVHHERKKENARSAGDIIPLRQTVKKEFMNTMNSTLLTGGDFIMPPKKGQKFNRYDDETKREAVRLRMEEQWSYSQIQEKLGIKCDAQIVAWIRKYLNGNVRRLSWALDEEAFQQSGRRKRIPESAGRIS